MNPAFVSAIVFMVTYVAAVGLAAGSMLWLQRKVFLHPDEDQSFTVPGIAAFGVGVIFLWMVMTNG